jgi:gliding motility-associated-like protein
MLWLGVAFGQKPVAGFNSIPVSGCAPLTVNFQDLSSGNPTVWQWNLGNSTLSNQQTPTTTYFNPGTYTVSLKVSNASGSDSITKIQYITVYDNPAVDFSASNVTGCFPAKINFTDLSTSGSGSITNWSWDFGDGDTSALQNPLHKFTTTGNYSITLKVTNSNGCTKILPKIQYIKIPNGVIVNFNNSPTLHCKPPETINFTNLSTGPSTLSYQWNFGDGNISTIQNPSNTYLNGGVYSVQLITTSSTGCVDTLVKNDSIVINNFQTAFSGPDSICVGVTANFSNTSIPLNTNSLWNFGDSTSSILNNPTKIWATPATYQVKLINDYGVCIDSVIKPVNVSLPPVANFIATDTFSCKAPFTTQFTDLTPGGISWSWNFGDGFSSTMQNPTHTYTSTGQFTVILSVKNGLGCTSTITRNQYIKIIVPMVTITGTSGGCIPFIYTPTSNVNDPNGVASYLWNFGDGNTSTIQNPTNVYTSAGTYTIKLFVTTNDGCLDSAIVAGGIKTGTPPTANFSAAPLVQCVGQNIQFTDMSTLATSWMWNFGDGGSSAAQNPLHAYLSNGPFNVTLTVMNNGCPASITKNGYVNALPPVAKFTPVFSCANKLQVGFTDNSVLPQTWSWNFGDGNTSNSQSPSHTYPALGTYNVTLTVTNGACTDSKTIPITLVDEHPDFTLSKDSICKNSVVSITVTNVNVANIVNFTYTYGDGQVASGGTASSVGHFYRSSGLFSIKVTTTDIHGCTATTPAETPIYVHGPIANFAAAPLAGCKGLNVIFTDKSITDGINSIKKWQWTYGDGIIENLTAPPFSHTYNTTGNFFVNLKVTDSSSCTDTLTLGTPIQVTQPKAAFTSADTASCIEANVTLNSTSTGVNLGYAWTLGNGFSSNQQNPVTTYPVDSTYSIKLVVTDINGCQDSLQKNNYINLKTAKAGFSINDSVSSCSPFQVNFTNTSINNISQLWDFGDSSTSNSKNPTHYYTTPGKYTATLFAISQGGCLDSLKHTIQLFPSTAILTFSPITGCSQLLVNFHLTTAGPVSYFWDFGDGNTIFSKDSTIANTYLLPGSYVPKVILTDSTGCQIPVTGSDTIHLTKSIVNFAAIDSAVCHGTSVVFSDSSSTNSTIISWHWNFGDDSTSPLQNPTHLYTASGTYTVQLIVTTKDGCSDSLTKNNYVHIYGPIAKFNALPLAGCKPLNVVFTDGSTTDGIHLINNWQWNFGDGSIQNFSAAPFNHLYDTSGSFLSQLKITDNFGCSDSFSLVTPVFITQPKAAFNSEDTNTCAGSNVSFNNISSGINLGYAWTLGNGSSSNLLNPVTSYSADGNYTIKLVVTDSIGCKDSSTLNNYIKVQTVKASFTVNDSVSSCPPLNVTFTNTSVNDSSFTWDFGDGTSSNAINPTHSYTGAGAFIATLIVTGKGGCIDSTKKTINVYASGGVLTYSPLAGCSQVNVNFNINAAGPVTYSWDFNDGNIVSSALSSISHNYTIPGSYLPSVIIKDPNGCQVTVTGSDTIHLTKSIVNFAAASSTTCLGGTISFNDLSTSNSVITFWHWDFGDGNTSSSQNPTHLYTVPGIYSVQLIVHTIDGCSDTLTKSNFVKINSVPKATITGDTTSCIPASLTFNGVLLQPDTSTLAWQWHFGNGNTSNSQNPSVQQYNTAGSFPLQLIVVTINGCADTINKTVIIHPLPTTDAGSNTTDCMGVPVQLQATGADTYIWSTQSTLTYLSCTNCSNPISTPADNIKYYVQGSTSFGCKTTDSVSITVNKKFTLTVTPMSDSFCIGQSVQLIATGADNYTWMPTTALSNSTINNPIASPDSTTTYKVVGSDNVHCFTDSASVKITVFNYPVVNAGPDINISAGASTTLTPQYSSDISIWMWTPPDGLSCTDCPNPIASPKNSTTYTITVANKGGCSAHDDVIVILPCGGTVFIPNTFSPNNDGKNDVFFPRGKDIFSIQSMRIFDRWGELVFQRVNLAPNEPTQGWDGTFNGQPASSDVYTYIIEIICNNSTISTFTGNVTLIR